MPHAFLLRLGLARTVLASSALAVLISVALTALTLWAQGSALDGTALLLSILIPTLIAPVFSTLHLRLVFQLYAAREDLRRLAGTDELTGVHNRRALMQALHEAFGAAQSRAEPLCVMLYDHDDFKRVNDEHGHLVGDEVLRRTSAAARAVLPAGALLARYGGEEFALLLPGTTLHRALVVAEQVRTAIAGVRVAGNGGAEVRVTISAGIASNSGAAHAEQLLAHADATL